MQARKGAFTLPLQTAARGNTASDVRKCVKVWSLTYTCCQDTTPFGGLFVKKSLLNSGGTHGVILLLYILKMKAHFVESASIVARCTATQTSVLTSSFYRVRVCLFQLVPETKTRIFTNLHALTSPRHIICFRQNCVFFILSHCTAASLCSHHHAICLC